MAKNTSPAPPVKVGPTVVGNRVMESVAPKPPAQPVKH